MDCASTDIQGPADTKMLKYRGAIRPRSSPPRGRRRQAWVAASPGKNSVNFCHSLTHSLTHSLSFSFSFSFSLSLSISLSLSLVLSLSISLFLFSLYSHSALRPSVEQGCRKAKRHYPTNLATLRPRGLTAKLLTHMPRLHACTLAHVFQTPSLEPPTTRWLPHVILQFTHHSSHTHTHETQLGSRSVRSVPTLRAPF